MNGMGLYQLNYDSRRGCGFAVDPGLADASVPHEFDRETRAPVLFLDPGRHGDTALLFGLLNRLRHGLLQTRRQRHHRGMAARERSGTNDGGHHARLLKNLARVELLILDDWAIAPLRDQERRDMLEILEDRHGTRSTILTSQMPVEKWHDYLADPTIADALLDRVVHNAHRIKLKGPSRRKPEG